MIKRIFQKVCLELCIVSKDRENLARTFDEWLRVWMDEWESCNEQEALRHINKNLLWSEKRTSVMEWVWLTFVILRWTYGVICHEQHCMLLQTSIISIRTVLHVAVPSEWMKRWSRKRNCSTKWKWKQKKELGKSKSSK